MSKIIVTDSRDYNPNLGSNGGGYSFSIIFTPTGRGTYYVSFKSSSDLPYCYKHGCFLDCNYCSKYVSRNCQEPYFETSDPIKFMEETFGISSHDEIPEGITVSVEI